MIMTNIDVKPSYLVLEDKIVAELKKGARARPELVKILGVPRTTIYDALRRLMKKNIVDTVQEYSGVTRKWCSNNSENTCQRKFSKCHLCISFVLKDGSPPLKKGRGRPRVMFYLLDQDKELNGKR